MFHKTKQGQEGHERQGQERQRRTSMMRGSVVEPRRPARAVHAKHHVEASEQTWAGSEPDTPGMTSSGALRFSQRVMDEAVDGALVIVQGKQRSS